MDDLRTRAPGRAVVEEVLDLRGATALVVSVVGAWTGPGPIGGLLGALAP